MTDHIAAVRAGMASRRREDTDGGGAPGRGDGGVRLGQVHCGRADRGQDLGDPGRRRRLPPPGQRGEDGAGRPLDDDRGPWLAALAGWLAQRAAAGERAVLSCSALRRSYRDVLRAAGTGVVFVHLAGPRELIADRLRQRAGHFMPPELLESQFAALEPLEPDEPGMTLDIGAGARILADQAVAYLAATAPPGAE